MADPSRQSARWRAAVVAVGLSLLPVGGSAQPRGVLSPRPAPAYAPPSRFATPPEEVDRPAEGYEVTLPSDEPGWVERTFGLERAKSLLADPSPTARRRGIARLGALGTTAAIGELALLLEDSSSGHDAATLRLEAVRALAAHASVDEARDALAAMAGSGSVGGASSSLDLLGLETAAMALARSGDARAITVLVAAVIQGGESGAWAEQALRAYPPAAMATLLGQAALFGKQKPLDRAVVRLLGGLADLRAIPILRRQLSIDRPAHRLAVAQALASLGDGSVAPLLRSWLRSPPKEPTKSEDQARAGATSSSAPETPAPWPAALRAESKLVAVEGLLSLDDPAGPSSLAALLAARATRKAGLDLALRWPSPALVGSLDALLRGSPTRDERERAVELLARIGDDNAAAVLLRMLARSEVSTLAAFGLASSPTVTARGGMDRALGAAPAGPARRLVLRAALVRYEKLGESVEGLDAALAQARASTDPADRWVAAQGLALRGIAPLTELLGSADPPTALGAASAAVALGETGIAACAERLGAIGASLDRAGPRADWALGPPDAAAPLEAIACGIGLLGASSPVSANVLARWAEAGGAMAPLAAHALGARDPSSLRDRTTRLLHGTDPTVRAHIALGLGRSPVGDATSLLAEAYRVEAEPTVRRAIVRALSLRRDPLRLAPLELAATLDPDPDARTLARSALRGRRHDVAAPPVGRAVLWVSLLGTAPGPAAASAAASRPVRVERDDGLTLPAVSAPDGNLLVFGLHRAGKVAVRIAPAPVLSDAPR